MNYRHCLIAIFAFSFIACSSSENSKEASSEVSNEWELQIVDSIQVDYLGSVRGGEFRNGKGVIFDFNPNKLIEFDETGEILNQQSYPKEGPGAVIYPTTLRYDEQGKLYGMSFLSWLYEFNPDLTLKRQVDMPFLAESQDGMSFGRNFEPWKDHLIAWYPGRDGANQYDPFFFRDHFLLEKLNINTGEAEPIVKIPPTSRYSSDKYYERTALRFGLVDEVLYLVLNNEPFIHTYDMVDGFKYLETIDFSPSVFFDNGEQTKAYEYISGSRMLDGRISGFYPRLDGIFITYTEGISEDIFIQNELKNPNNYPQYIDFQRHILKFMNTDSVWSNEIIIPNNIDQILNIESLSKPFYALRNDEYLGEEQDYLTFYKLQLVQKRNLSYIYILPFAFILIACSAEKEETTNSTPLSEQALEFEIYDSLVVDYLGMLSMMDISPDGNSILMIDMNTDTIFVTAKSGKILHKFKKYGDAPGNYTRDRYGVAVFANNQEFLIPSTSGIYK
ncbi:hypothetical protein SYJ56_23195 [Algoriphagus sp. D3-2-R+10]|uniref:hypothetical protein n=1 Tax=Algoriphagus aurantiacus TaxID=3103948 RepID=UPI002B3E7BE0|nr:hypothetical protein [Algoriphagus sp. D3-2-R+10]MEB2778236.1 hypothetical protein [Algoriphagus sp. D3-2-R+10]